MLADPASAGPDIASDPSAAEIDRQVQGMAGSWPSSRRSTGSPEVFADLTRNSNGDPPGHQCGARSGQVPTRARGHAASGDTGAAPRAVHQDLRHPAMTPSMGIRMTQDPISLLKGRMAEALVEAV